MNGIFLRKKFNGMLFLLFCCSLFLIGYYFFVNIVDSETANGSLTFLIMGILLCILVIPSWLLNIGAFIHIDEDTIKAKYHLFGRIDCKLSDVAFASADNNTLTIQLKNGKCYTIMGISNPTELASAIRRKMTFEITENPEALIEKLNNIVSAKKKYMIYVFSGVALMFINIFITVFLTGERELYEFSRTDWTIMAIMGAIELAIIFAAFYFAKKPGKKNIDIEKLKYAIKRTIIETKPLGFGYIEKVFTDYSYSGRITVFRCSDNESVYYIVQEFASDYTLFKSYESEVYENIEQLLEDIGTFIDITEKFYAKTAE